MNSPYILILSTERLPGYLCQEQYSPNCRIYAVSRIHFHKDKWCKIVNSTLIQKLARYQPKRLPFVEIVLKDSLLLVFFNKEVEK